MTQEFYTDRAGGAVPATNEHIPEPTRLGLIALIERRVDADWLAHEFPSQCADGNSVAGTNFSAFERDVSALIPGLEWPVAHDAPDDLLFDLIEYIAWRIAKPIQRHWHDYMRHFELDFKPREGQQEFRDAVNQLFRRGGTVFELTKMSQIQRVGGPELRRLLRELRPASGDSTLDDLVEDGRRLYQSRNPKERATGIEKMWDAFERLKTLEPPHAKPASAEALLAHIESEQLRDVIRAEMRALTDFGNQFRIRHAEVTQTPIPDDAQDYVAARMASLLILLMRATNRLFE